MSWTAETFCDQGFLVMRSVSKADPRQSVMLTVDLLLGYLDVYTNGPLPPECIVRAMLNGVARILKFGPFTEPPSEYYAREAAINKLADNYARETHGIEVLDLKPRLNPALN